MMHKKSIFGLSVFLVVSMLLILSRPSDKAAAISSVQAELGQEQGQVLPKTEQSSSTLVTQSGSLSSLTETAQAIARATPEVRQKGFSIVQREVGIIDDPVHELGLALQARVPHPAKPLSLPAGMKHRIQVKFVDEVVARIVDGNQISVLAASDQAVEELSELVSRNQLEFSPVFFDSESIEGVRKRAALRSKQMQADLNGTMFVELAVEGSVLEIAMALQDSSLIESVDIESLDQPPPPPVDIAPTTPSLQGFQGYLGTNPGFGVDVLWGLGARGQGVGFTDCEYGFNPNHEDLEDSGITDISRAAINSDVYDNGWDDHGTAAIGVSAAGDNGYGTTGIAPDATFRFASEWTTLGYNRSGAIADAVAGSSEGDIILLEMQSDGPLAGNSDYVPAEYVSSVWNLTKSATDAGIIVVAAGGNGNQNLDGTSYQSYMNRGDSGAIIVGAGSSSTSHSRLSYSCYGTRVDVQAWGQSVMTTGYGNYAIYGGDENQAYTSGFNGTSSASACAAGVVTLLQSYAINTLGTLFTPEEMRSHLKSYAHNQGGSGSANSIGPALALDLAVVSLPSEPPNLGLSDLSSAMVRLIGLPFRSYKVEATSDYNIEFGWTNWMTGVAGDATGVNINLLDEISKHDRRTYRMSEE